MKMMEMVKMKTVPGSGNILNKVELSSFTNCYINKASKAFKASRVFMIKVLYFLHQ